MHGIEHQDREQLYEFTLVDPLYFESLDRYEPKVPGHGPLLRSLLPPAWRAFREGTWYHAHPPDERVPPFGFKFHVSVLPELADACIQVVVPVCVAAGVAFKLCIDRLVLEWMCSPAAPVTSSGKFMTIYPHSDSQLLELGEALHQATRDLWGPFVLTDARYPESRALFYRFGSFRVAFDVDVFGQKRLLFAGDEAPEREDVRQAGYTLPARVEDPFGAEPVPRGGSITLADRYLVDDVIGASNKGGVFRAVDQRNGERVVIKEARPGIRDGAGNECVERLWHEASVLKRLAHTGLVPRVVDCFREWEHTFLVLEELPGEPLTSYRARPELAVIGAADPGQAMRQVARLVGRLWAGLLCIHEAGVVLGDLAPQNIMVDPDSGRCWFIDMETAALTGVSQPLPWGTPGFVSPQRKAGLPIGVADDRFALRRIAMSLVLPITPLFDLAPELEQEWAESLAEAAGIQAPLQEIFDWEPHHSAEIDPFVDKFIQRIEDRAGGTRLPAARAAVPDNLSRLSAAVLESMTPERLDRLFPADCRVYGMSPFGLGFGAAGVALFVRECGEVPVELLDAIATRKGAESTGRLSPGLFAGAAGLAWTFAELGDLAQAEALMSEVYAHEQRFERCDFFYGCAGWGLVALDMFQRTGDPRHLGHAVAAADELRRRLGAESDLDLPVEEDGVRHHGVAHGAAGIALFLLRLFDSVQDGAVLELAERLMRAEFAGARSNPRGMTWPSTLGGDLLAPWWRYGNAGIAPVALRFYDVLGNPAYLALAGDAAQALRGAVSTVPGYVSGLAGMGQVFLDLHERTHDPRDRAEAERFATLLWRFRVETPTGGVAFPGEDLLRACHDFATGTAGVGLFLARLAGSTTARTPIDIGAARTP